MSESKRKIFTGAQKAKVALESIKGAKTINQIAQEFGVHPTQVHLWKKELLENAGSLFEGKRGSKPADTQGDRDRLYAKIGDSSIWSWTGSKKSPGYVCRRTAKRGGFGSTHVRIKAMPACFCNAFSCVCNEKASTERGRRI